jgi:RimJ/RimL family protein N-acetyltransferase
MVTLVPMTQAEFESYLEAAIREYADDHVRAGNWAAEGALERSRQEFDALLPQGVNTPQQYVFSIHADDADRNIGMLWFADRRATPGHCAWIYDFVIQEEYRGRGYGALAMRALEDQVRAVGLDKISLHVFGDNRVARGLYAKMGYVETNVLMSKKLQV